MQALPWRIMSNGHAEAEKISEKSIRPDAQIHALVVLGCKFKQF